MDGYTIADFAISGKPLKAWTSDPGPCELSYYLNTGTIIFSRIKWPGGTFGNVIMMVQSATGTTVSQVAVYDLAGNRLGVSSDFATSINTSSPITINATVPPLTNTVLSAQDIYVCYLYTGSTALRYLTDLAVNGVTGRSTILLSTSPTAYRAGKFNTGVSAFPATVNPATASTCTEIPWFAIT